MIRHLLLLGLLVASATAKEPCHCSAFITVRGGEMEVHKLPTSTVHTCEEHEQCKHHCYNEFSELSGHGNLDHISSDGVTTVGQVLCYTLRFPVSGEYVFAYSRVCEGPWEWTEGQSQQRLCCDLNQVYTSC
ncbi:uncharacterized protein LOC121861894 [Homarus americanus]|uniref:Uncharacterized protein n=1 Tax=Homarus americanus TaxID=6706 RepID=A0A8J5N330_HOMAM|nr:uncharacterized protein LOC121861894 [Homarus americanus]KAG7172402.1 hypothetical protein Hamer_G026663 [Homarus americanus]